jgi:hypothetical protein
MNAPSRLTGEASFSDDPVTLARHMVHQRVPAGISLEQHGQTAILDPPHGSGLHEESRTV